MKKIMIAYSFADAIKAQEMYGDEYDIYISADAPDLPPGTKPDVMLVPSDYEARAEEWSPLVIPAKERS